MSSELDMTWGTLDLTDSDDAVSIRMRRRLV